MKKINERTISGYVESIEGDEYIVCLIDKFVMPLYAIDKALLECNGIKRVGQPFEYVSYMRPNEDTGLIEIVSYYRPLAAADDFTREKIPLDAETQRKLEELLKEEDENSFTEDGVQYLAVNRNTDCKDCVFYDKNVEKGCARPKKAPPCNHIWRKDNTDVIFQKVKNPRKRK